MDCIAIYLKKYYVCGWSHSLSLLNTAKKDFRQNAALRTEMITAAAHKLGLSAVLYSPIIKVS